MASKLQKKIIILLSTYNGQNYLPEQIESIVKQDIRYNDDYAIEILARDDGSSDDTVRLLEKYADVINIAVISGKNIGPARSFWALLQNAPDADYYAFCDQDDVWFEDKLSRAIEELEKHDSTIPQLYCSDVIWVNKKLKPLDVQPSGKKYTDFPHSLLYSLSPGCTFVFNQSAAEMARKYDMDKEYVTIHDWLLHKIVAMTGEVHYDPEPSMYYRQHGGNVIGAKNEGIRGIPERAKRFLTSSECVRSNTAKSLQRVYRSYLISHPEKKYYVDLVANYQESLRDRSSFLKECRFKRGIGSSTVLTILTALGKI